MKKQGRLSCGVCGGQNIEWTDETNGEKHHPILVCVECEEREREEK